MFDTWRFHAFFTTTDPADTVTADKTHRGHAIIEQVHADLKNSALAHLPCLIFSSLVARRVDLLGSSWSVSPTRPSTGSDDWLRFLSRRVAWAADDRGGALFAEGDREGLA